MSYWLSFATGIVVSDWLGSMMKMQDGLKKDIIAFPAAYGSYFLWRIMIVFVESKCDKEKLIKMQNIKTTKGNVFAVLLSLISTIAAAMLIGKYVNEWSVKRYGYSQRVSGEIGGCFLLFWTFFGIWSIVIVWIENALWKRKVKNRPNNQRKKAK